MGKEKKSYKKFLNKKKLGPKIEIRKKVQKINKQKNKRHQKFIDAVDQAKQTEVKKKNQIAKEKELYDETENFTELKLTEDDEISSDEIADDISEEEEESEIEENIIKEETVEKHKEDIEKLKEADPEFYKYLKEQDKELLEFDIKKEIKNEEERLQKEKIILLSDINKWKDDFELNKDFENFKPILEAYEAACSHGRETEDTTINNNIKTEFENSEAYYRAIFMALEEADRVFRRYINIKEKKWKEESIEKAFIKYINNTMSLIVQQLDNNTLEFILQRLIISIDMISRNEAMIHNMTKIILKVFENAEESSQLQITIILKKIISFSFEKTTIFIFKELVRIYLNKSKMVVVRRDFDNIKVIRSIITEIYVLYPDLAYERIFSSIREMSLKFRHALIKYIGNDYFVKPELIYTLELWSALLIEKYQIGELRYLVFPLVQLMMGMVKKCRDPSYFPIRLRMLRNLHNMSMATGYYIPIAHAILALYNYRRFKNRYKLRIISKPDKNFCDFEMMMSVYHKLTRRSDYNFEAFSQITELLCGHLAQYSRHISFPEMCYYPLNYLKAFKKNMIFDGYKVILKLLLRAIHPTYIELMKRRENVSFLPGDYKSIKEFNLEKSEKPNKLEKLYEKMIRDRERRFAILYADEIQLKNIDTDMEEVKVVEDVIEIKKPDLETDDNLVDYILSDVD